MRHRPLAALLGLVLAILPACGQSASPDPQAAQRWAGRFESTFGPLALQAQDGKVTGSYAFCGGRLEGTPKGNRLTGEWTEDPAACGPRERRAPGAPSGGSFEFTLAADGSGFTGKWRYEDGVRDPRGDEWRGRRVGAR